MIPRRQSENATARPEGGVKAKIDEIEQQMVGASFSPSGRRNSGFFTAPTEPAVLARSAAAALGSHAAGGAARGAARAAAAA